MVKITIKKKTLQNIGLIFLGVLLGLIILEIGLRIGGFVVLYLQHHADSSISEENGKVITILALGESTTANLQNGQSSWPEELEIILNNGSKDVKFKVFNEGIPGSRTYKIVARLEGNLDKYNPDMVIAMMGTNDKEDILVRHDTLGGKIKLSLQDFRVYKLFKRIIEGLKYKYMKEYYAEGWIDEQKQNKINEEAYKEKEKKLKKILEAEPENIEILFELEKLYDTHRKVGKSGKSANDKFEDYEKIAKKIIAVLDSNDPKSSYYIGMVYWRLGEYKKAEERFKKFIDSSANYEPTIHKYEPYYMLGLVYTESNKTVEARDMFAAYLQMGGEVNIDLLIRLANLYGDLNNTQRVYKILKKVIYSTPTREAEILWFGKVYRQLNNSDDAIPVIEYALAKNHTNFAAYTELTWYYLINKMPEKAEDMFSKAMQINPDFLIKVYANMGVRYQEIGEFQKSKEMLEKASKLRKQYYNPTTQESYLALYRITSERGIRLIVMQYPTLDVNDLKSMFRGDEKIIFVSNKENFEKALANATFEEYFVDRIHEGTFGHGTRKGNRLIAENVANEILKLAK